MFNRTETTETPLKIGIFIVAYNAEKTIQSVLTRIPRSTWDRITEVFVFDDGSKDQTADQVLHYDGYGAEKVLIFVNQTNLGYGGNQKRGYLYAEKRGLDIVVLLHGDGQYAPECLDSLINPIAEGRAEAVFGSRMLISGAARKGGMPVYKFAGNKILTSFQNFILKQHFSEYHSGFRAYNVHCLSDLPLLKNSNDFHFDTEIIIQLLAAGYTIQEVPIPTYYGSEICYVNGVKYAWQVFTSTLSYSLHNKGLLYDPRFDVSGGAKYQYKHNRFSSHQQIVTLIAEADAKDNKHVLEVGCGSGDLAARIAEKGYQVTGVDIYDNERARKLCRRFIVADIEQGLGPAGGQQYDLIVLADVLEHTKSPEQLLLQGRALLADGGAVIASTGNIAHLLIRLMLLFGRFEYAERGILDRTHVRLFTTRTFRKLFPECGFNIRRVRYCPVPFERIIPGWPALTDALSWLNMVFVRILPGLFAYQIIVEAVPKYNDPSTLLREAQIHDEYLNQKTGIKKTGVT